MPQAHVCDTVHCLIVVCVCVPVYCTSTQVPGSGFGQEEGTFHLRTTILPREEVMQGFVQKFKTFHEQFMKEYA